MYSRILRPRSSRCLVTLADDTPSARYMRLARADDPATSETPPDLTPQQRERLDSALRVDLAGEIAANWIYRGQMAILGKDPQSGPLIQEMWDQEKKHLKVMVRLQQQHRIRPTILTEACKIAGFGLGAVTALIGREGAMACTEAVETVIGEHYDDQLNELGQISSDHPSIPLLRDIVTELRDDELEHLDTAVSNFSQRAPAHALLSTIVGVGCKAAIAVCKRI